MTSDTASTIFGGSARPPRPVKARNASIISRLGANADARTDIERTPKHTRATGRRPNESDRGPPQIPIIAQPTNVAVANCPATATEISRSVAISTSSGRTIRIALMVAYTVSASTAMNHALFTSLRPVDVAGVAILSVPLSGSCRNSGRQVWVGSGRPVAFCTSRIRPGGPLARLCPVNPAPVRRPHHDDSGAGSRRA